MFDAVAVVHSVVGAFKLSVVIAYLTDAIPLSASVIVAVVATFAVEEACGTSIFAVFGFIVIVDSVLSILK